MNDQMTTEDVFAVPGEGQIVDLVRPDGRGAYSGEALDAIRLRYPGAIRMPFDAWLAWKAAQQDTPITWHQTTHDAYDRALGELPPIDWTDHGFLIGEPTDHSAATGAPRYQAYRVTAAGQHFLSNRPLTRREWREAQKSFNGQTSET